MGCPQQTSYIMLHYQQRASKIQIALGGDIQFFVEIAPQQQSSLLRLGTI